MKPFLDADFLLQTDTARYLFHEHAARMPVIDYHCHLSPELIAKDYRFENLTRAWLYGDHYKWRAMRANGIPEKYITGKATDEEKFAKWAETVPYTMRNPLYHWTHLELQRYFGITDLLSPDTGQKIYQQASELLQSPGYSVRSLLEKMNVEIICTTDDPLDDLEYHRQIAESGWKVKVLPTWRPDRVLDVTDPDAWNHYIDRLAEITRQPIDTYDDLISALRIRHDYFHAHGCRLSDHGMETFPANTEAYNHVPHPNAPLRFNINPRQLLLELSRMNHEKGWTQQFHTGAQRNNNTRALKQLGRDTGFDSIGDQPVAREMAAFLDHLESEGKLARTILYNLNPADNEMFASMTGNFQDGSVRGKIQWGAAWWFLDQKQGIEQHLNTLSNFGLLSRFVGMLTDSRSFLSYPRHEYFRRILCNLIGQDVENGELPDDRPWLGKMVENICHNNAKEYFGF